MKRRLGRSCVAFFRRMCQNGWRSIPTLLALALLLSGVLPPPGPVQAITGFPRSVTPGSVWGWGATFGGLLADGVSQPSDCGLVPQACKYRLHPVPAMVPSNVTSVSMTVQHVLFLTTDGTVWASGYQAYGALGNGVISTSATGDFTKPLPIPVQVRNADGSPFGGVKSVFALGTSSFAIKTDGTLWAWGGDTSGALGIPGPAPETCLTIVPCASHPIQVSQDVNGNPFDNVVAIAGGGTAFALKGDGTVWSWGANSHGGLGSGSLTDPSRQRPGQVVAPFNGGGFLTHIVALGDAAAVDDSGHVWTWGDDFAGSLGTVNDPPFDCRPFPDSAPMPCVPYPVQVQNGDGSAFANAVDVHRGGTVFARKSDGTLWGWGINQFGNIGDGTTTERHTPVQVRNADDSPFTDALDVATGTGEVFVLKSDRTVWGWGWNVFGGVGDGTTTERHHPVPVRNFDNSPLTASLLSAGAEGVMVVKAETDTTPGYTPPPLPAGATPFTWGDNAEGELGDGSFDRHNTPRTLNGLTNVVAMAGGSDHTLALKDDGSTWAVGRNDDGELGIGTFGGSIPTARQVNGVNNVGKLTGVTAVAAGRHHSLALRFDGTVVAWGAGTNGQLGNGANSSSGAPVQVSGLTDVIAIAAGNSHSLALKGDGTVWGWGANTLGQLGDGVGSGGSNTPVRVGLLTGIVKIAAGGDFGLALRAPSYGGAVFSWGADDQGQLGDNATAPSRPAVSRVLGTGDIEIALNSVVNGPMADVAAGGAHALAASNDASKKVYAWGDNQYGQLGDNSTTDRLVAVAVRDASNTEIAGVTSVAAGGVHSLALAPQPNTSVKLWSWGNNSFDQLGIGSGGPRSTATLVNLDGVQAIEGGALFSLATSSVAANVPLQITTGTPLPPATAGQVYQQSLTANGGTAPYIWSLAGGALPQGLALNQNTGVIGGTPAAATAGTTASFTIQVRDQNGTGTTATRAYTLPIAAAGGGSGSVELNVTTTAPSTVGTGSALAYSILVRNDGTASASGVTLTDSLGGATFVSASSGCTASAGTVTCSIGTLAAQSSTIISIAATAPGSAGTVSNTATVSPTDGTPSNNSTTATTAVVQGGGRIRVTVADRADPVSVGDQVIWDVTITNISGVTIQHGFSAGVFTLGDQAFEAISANVSGLGECHAGTFGTYACSTVNPIDPGQSRSFTVAARPLPFEAGATFTLNVSAVISHQDDPSDAQYNVSTTTRFNPAVDLAVNVVPPSQPVAATTPLTYSVVAVNNPYDGILTGSGQPQAASDVVLTSTLPAGATFQSAALVGGGACTHAGDTVTCLVGALASGASKTAQITVVPPAAGTFNVSAHVGGSIQDFEAANDTDHAALTVGDPPLLVSTTTASLPHGAVGVAYSATLAATGGKAPYRWDVSVGSLPPGLSLSGSGQLTGKPTADGPFSFTVRVTDANGTSATRPLTLTVDVPPPCTFGPKVGVSVAKDGSGGLVVTLVAVPTTGTPNNRLKELRFEAGANVRIDVPAVAGGRAGLVDASGNVTLTLTEQPDHLTFSLHRRANGAATVQLTVVDGCGTWHTFVGGGANGF